MIKNKQQGFGLISLIILLAVIFAALNVYSYYNPKFSLAKYSPLNYLRAKRDEVRVKDLKTLEKAIIAYYNDKGEVPATDSWCGRINSVLHPEVDDQIRPYINTTSLPHDPSPNEYDQDYFYYRQDKRHYVLMAVLELPKNGNQGLNIKGCHDWPGDNVYNFRLDNLEGE